MFESFSEIQKKGVVIAVTLGVIMIALSGLWFGFFYFILDEVHTAFLSTDCVIDNNTLVSSCQDLFGLALYPFLQLKEVLVWVSFFFIFSLVLGMLVLGYRAGKSPVLMGYLFVIVSVLTYMGIEISNIYRQLIANEVFRDMMVEFTVYNRIMLYFPWFVFIVALAALFLGIVNYQKGSVNKFTDDLDY